MRLKALCLLLLCAAIMVSGCRERREAYSGKMIYIPACTFMMGNKGHGADDDDYPRHSVYLSSYYIGKYEVTRGEYRKFVDSGGYSKQEYWSSKGWDWKESNKRTQPDYWDAKQTWMKDKPFTQTDNCPVVGVSYFEAEAFCNWIGGHLPTEAQWEKAASWNVVKRHSNVYPWGDTENDENYNNYNDHNPAGGGFACWQTAPVGSFPGGASSYGCQDMSGNVKEWCQDWYSADYYSKTPKSDPQGLQTGFVRVLRGGSWNCYFGDSVRCSSRDSYYPDSSSYTYVHGFRVAR